MFLASVPHKRKVVKKSRRAVAILTQMSVIVRKVSIRIMASARRLPVSIVHNT